MLPLEDILARFKVVKQSGNDYDALCPAHDDTTPSLRLTHKGDRVLFTCHRGCDGRDILAATGLSWQDVGYSKPNGNGHAKPEAKPKIKHHSQPDHVYQYTDLHGRVLYEVIRWDARPELDLEKDIRLRREYQGGTLWGINEGWFVRDKRGNWRKSTEAAPKAVHVEAVAPVLYRWPEVQAKIDSGRGAIFVVEGEKCVEALRTIDVVATTNHGGASSKDGNKWKPHFSKALVGAPAVYVIPDNDGPGHRHADAVLTSLRLAGVNALRLELPGLGDGEDVADWIARGGTKQELARLCAAAAKAPEPAPMPEKAKSGPDDDKQIVERVPLRLAESFLDRYHRDGATTLRRYRDEWWLYNGSSYDILTREALAARIYKHLDTLYYLDSEGEPKPIQAKINTVNEVLAALPAVGTLVEAQDMPVWLDGEAHPLAREVISCRNGLLHLPKRELLPASPHFFCASSLPFDYDPTAVDLCAWEDFLGITFAGDQESIDLLQEWFGYALTTDTSQQKMMLLVGPPRSGKGTIAHVLTALLGPSNVVSPGLASIGGAFGLQPLLDKRLAVISDARISGKSDQAVIIERMLSISGEDMVTVDRKNLDSLSLQLHTRFMVLTNELPRLTDQSGALASRFLILKTGQSFLGREDMRLRDKLLATLPSVLNWAIDGWHRLQRQGRFTAPKSALEVQAQLTEITSPCLAFLTDTCEFGPNVKATMPAQTLFGLWQSWCKDQGIDNAGTLSSFSRNLRAAAPHVRTHYGRDAQGKRMTSFQGIGIARAYETVETPVPAHVAPKANQPDMPKPEPEVVYADDVEDLF